MKNLLLLIIILSSCYSSTKKQQNTNKNYFKTIQSKLTKDYNQDVVFYVDLSKPSSEYRFFVINVKDSLIINQGLCCNGRTDDNGNVMFSNVPGSKCSSKGAYKIGASYTGRFGKAFKLHGLESTNSNAYCRAVVLHSYKGIPRNSWSLPICKSEGCPTVNPDYLKELTYYINKSKKPILLIIS